MRIETSIELGNEPRLALRAAARCMLKLMEYDPTVYAGAAAHYRKGRPPYSANLTAVLREQLRPDGSGRVLDVGCGPGFLSMTLSPLFAEVVALDPDAAMLGEGKRAAEENGVRNVAWILGRAEELPHIAPGPFDVVTFGNSFHWTDEARVTELVYDILRPGGSMVLIYHSSGSSVTCHGDLITGSEDTVSPPSPGPPPIPHEAIDALVKRYLGSLDRAGQGRGPTSVRGFETTLPHSRFRSSRTVFAPGRRDIVRDIDGVVSSYLSTGFAAPHLFGDALPQFVSDLTELLTRFSPTGKFWDWPGDTEIIIANKPN